MNLASSRKKLVLKDRLFVFLHFILRALLPVVVFLTVAVLDLSALAYGLVLLSKWRVLASKPRFWWPNLQGQLVDLVCVLSIVYFMSWPSLSWQPQLIWLVAYLFWVFGLKGRDSWYHSLLRGLAVQGLGVSLLVYSVNRLALPLILIGVWLVSLVAARHVLNGLQKMRYHKSLMHIWGLFALQLAWVLLHWQVTLWVLPRLAFLLVLLLFSSSLLYALHLRQALPIFLRRQIIVSSLIVVFFVLLLTSVHAVAV